MLLEAGISEVRVRVPRDLEEALGVELKGSQWKEASKVGSREGAIWVHGYGKLAELEGLLGPLADFGKKNNLRIVAAGAALQVYSQLPGRLHDTFKGNCQILNSQKVLISVIHGCLEDREGLSKVVPTDFLKDPTAPVTRVPSTEVAYPYLLLDVRTNSTFTLVA